MTLKRRIAAGERLVGGLLRMPGESLVEVAGVAGMDFVVVDCEHGPADPLAVQHHIQIAEGCGMATLIRVGRTDLDFVLRVLDLGAAGIIAPHVDTADEATRIVRAARYPPVGDRGFATYTRAGRFGANGIAEHLADAEAKTLVAAMVETPTACANIDEIVAVPGVDAVLVGPADLSVAMGLTGGPAEPAVAEATRSVVASARRAGTPMLTIVNTPDQGRDAPPGAVLYNLAHVLLTRFRELVDQLR